MKLVFIIVKINFYFALQFYAYLVLGLFLLQISDSKMLFFLKLLKYSIPLNIFLWLKRFNVILCLKVYFYLYLHNRPSCNVHPQNTYISVCHSVSVHI